MIRKLLRLSNDPAGIGILGVVGIATGGMALSFSGLTGVAGSMAGAAGVHYGSGGNF